MSFGRWSVCALIVLCAAGADAQPRLGPSLDLTAGAAGGVGAGDRAFRGLLSVDGLLARRPRASRGLLVGITSGMQAHLGVTACAVADAPSFGCAAFPELTYLGVLAGWEVGGGSVPDPTGTLRLLAGAALVGVSDRGEFQRTIAFPMRLDAATPQVLPVTLVLSLQSTVVPRRAGQMLSTWAVRAGLRLR